MQPPQAILDVLTARLGPARLLRPLSGGDTHAAACLEVGGARCFLKWSRTPHPFAAEAAGLQALRAAGSPLVIPAPLSWDAQHLALEWLEPGPPAPDAALGEGLAALHRASAPAFGFSVDNTCGATPQPNPWTEDWPTFYRAHRLEPLLARLPAALRRAAAPVLDRLPALLASDAPAEPALIHGDLWAGNHLHTGRGHALVDPAASFSHREAELGMMTLFGGFSAQVYDAYTATWPLASGWRERVPLYQLYHLLNHAVLFGGGYGEQARAVLRRYA